MGVRPPGPPGRPPLRGPAAPAPPSAVRGESLFEERGAILVVRLVGEFAEYVDDLMRSVLEQLEQNPRHVVLNLSQVTYISSRGLGQIFELHKRLQKAGRKLHLAALSAQVAEVFDVAGLSEILRIYPDEEAALARL